jgi:hypothetical protein
MANPPLGFTTECGNRANADQEVARELLCVFLFHFETLL